MVTTAITAGLHKLPDYDNSHVTAASEYQRRLFSSIYCNDKTHASLNGTPPLLTRLFCNVQPCLDLPDGVLFMPQVELVDAIKGLDTDGWNTMRNTYQATTILRGKVKMAIIREEILELALGVNVEVSEHKVKYVLFYKNHGDKF